MSFLYLIYSSGEFAAQAALRDEFCGLLEEARRHGVRTLDAAPDGILNYVEASRLPLQDALVVTCRDAVLERVGELKAAALAYRNPAYGEESLFAAAYLAEGFAEIDFSFLERVYQRKHAIPWRVIETERCYLREISPEDMDDMYRICEEPSVKEAMSVPCGREDAEEYLKAYTAGMYGYYGYGLWLLKERDTDELIGFAGLNHLELDGEYFLEMGYAVAGAHRGQGYAAEACRAVISYAQGEASEYGRLCCFVREDNEASRGLLDRLGFSCSGMRVRDGRKLLLYDLSLKNME